MSSNYDMIREENIEEYGKGTRHLSFLGRLYTDRTHFIFELLQNAEDAEASKILFELFEDRLEVRHDGRPFDEHDVRGVCGVGEGTKAEDLTQIGKFGIGFKSVYAYTSTPEVHSGTEHFRIEHYVRPYKTDIKIPGDSWDTLFVFAFNAPNIEPQTAVHEIAERLRNLSVRTLLFLRNIKEIEFRLPDGTNGVYLREAISRGQARQVTVIGQNDGQEEDENWLIFTRPISNPNSANTVCVEIGFKLNTDANNHTESIVKIKKSSLVVYFPTEKSTRFGFLIQGPYRTTPSRDNIPKDDDWNTKLVEETALLLVDALQHLKKMGLLTVTLLNALPIRMDDFPENNMFYPIVEAVHNALLNQELFPADDNTFVSGKNAKLARGSELRKLLSQYQLKELFNTKVLIKWLSEEITQDRTPDLRSYLINELNIDEITPEGFARRISGKFLANQTDDWFIEFYKYLSSQEALWRRPRWSGDRDGILRNKPILRLQNNKQEKPFRFDGTVNVYLPPPEETDFPIVKREITNNEQALDFLKRLGLSEPDIFADIVERVLPKYKSENAQSITSQEHTMDIQKILRAMSSDSETGKGKVLRAAKDTPFLRAVDKTGKTAFQKPGNIYWKDENLELYFSNTDGIWFLDEPSVNSLSNDKVWANFGIAFRPRRIQFSGGISYNIKEHSTRSEYIENYDLEGLPEFLEYLENDSKGLNERKKLSLILWNYLTSSLDDDSQFLTGQYQWFYYYLRNKSFDSQILVRLRDSAWIATRDGNLKQPENVTLDQLYEEFLGSGGLIEILGIQQDSSRDAVEKEPKESRYANELGIGLDDVEFIKNHPDEFKQLKATVSAKKATVLAKKEKPVFPERKLQNAERRQARVAEQISAAPQKQYEQRSRSVRATGNTIDQETYLKEAYTNNNGEMVCQICQEEMPFKKRDGEYYFEAVEMFSKDHFPQEHEAQYLALCPLCAAMYKEFVKRDEAAMATLKNALATSEKAEIPLQLGERTTSVRFVERHFLDIKTILETMEGA